MKHGRGVAIIYVLLKCIFKDFRIIFYTLFLSPNERFNYYHAEDMEERREISNSGDNFVRHFVTQYFIRLFLFRDRFAISLHFVILSCRDKLKGGDRSNINLNVALVEL